MWAAVRENGDFLHLRSNNWESVEDRWVHAATSLASTELSFHSCNVLRDATGASPGQTKNEGGVRKNDDFFQLWFE